MLFLKAAALWCLFVLVAIANAGARDNLFVRRLGRAALPLSGLTLSAAILALTWLAWPWFGPMTPSQARAVGGAWAAVTVVFEVVFACGLLRQPWPQVAGILHVQRGNLWLLVIAATALAPTLAARLRGVE
jgi:hypothetical protein